MRVNNEQSSPQTREEHIGPSAQVAVVARRFRWWHALPVVVLVVAIGGFVIWRSFASGPTTAVFDTSQPHIKDVSKVGRLAVPANIVGRDGGGSVVLGGKILWLYGDTFYRPNFSPNPPAPDIWRSATSSYSDFNDPYNAIQGGVDERGNPLQVIPLTAEEAAYNRAKNNPQDRYIVWPSGQVAQDSNTALLFFLRFLYGADKSAGMSGVGVATLHAGEGVATRQSNLLFGPNEPGFRESMVKDGFVYLYAIDCGSDNCPVARAPLAQATSRSAYTFWDGTRWNMDVSKAKPVVPASNYGFSVMWSDALGKYIDAKVGNFSRQVYFSFADAPQGPWSNPVKAFELAGETTYVPYFHPELSKGQDIYMSYTRNNDSCKSPCTDTGGIEMMKITLETAAVAGGGSSTSGSHTSSGTPAGSTTPQSQAVKLGVSGGKDVASQRKAYDSTSSSGSQTGPQPIDHVGLLGAITAFFSGIWQTILSWF